MEMMELRKAVLDASPSPSVANADFVGNYPAPMIGLKVGMSPIQDLHGYDNPWPAGGGRNLLGLIGQNTTYIGVAVAYDPDTEIYTLNGTANNVGNITLAAIPKDRLVLSENTTYTISSTVVGGSFTIPTGTGNTYALSMFNTQNNKYWRGAVNLGESGLNGYSASGLGFTTSANYSAMIQVFRSGMVFNNLKVRIQIEEGSTATAWSPYSNICPITGRDEVSVTRTDGGGQQSLSLTIPFGDTVYGGTVDVISGELIITHGYIASYNGETISEPWISSMDKYVAGTLPTVGAAVCYPLATPITVTLTPQQMSSLIGQNHFMIDGGTLSEVEYWRHV